MTYSTRRRLLAALAWGLTTSAASLAAPAPQFPNKPVTIVVPAPPGGTADTVIRTVGARLTDVLGQPVIIENKPGAGGVIASQDVARAAPDGYTLLMVYTSHAINPWLVAKLPYDTASAFAPVALLGRIPLLVAVPATSPDQTPAQLIDDARKHPGALSFGTSAVGGASDLGGELFSQLSGGKLVRVPYKGGAAAATDLAAGRISMLLDTQLALQPLAQAKRIKIIGVASEKPSVVFPDLVPMGRLLPGFEATAWFGIMAPAGTPAPIVDRLNAALNRILKEPAIAKQLVARGFQPETMAPAGWADFIATETKRWGALIAQSKLSGK